MILSVSDFKSGITKVAGSLANQNTTADFETFLTEENENKYIREMLGYDLGNEFIADLFGDPSEPSDPKWILVFNPFNFELNNCPRSCIGIKEILVYLMYNDYVSQQNIQNQFGGNKSIRSEASSNEGVTGKTTVVHNRAVENIDILQAYIQNDSTDYPDFKGLIFEYQSGL